MVVEQQHAVGEGACPCPPRRVEPSCPVARARLGGLLFLVWVRVEGPWAFYLIWALIGPMQVAGRIVFMGFSTRWKRERSAPRW